MDDTCGRDLVERLNQSFEAKVEVPRIGVGKRQTVETLINEEASLFAMSLRGEISIWKPRTYCLVGCE